MKTKACAIWCNIQSVQSVKSVVEKARTTSQLRSSGLADDLGGDVDFEVVKLDAHLCPRRSQRVDAILVKLEKMSGKAIQGMMM
jgi:hypothetical protein